MCFQSFSHFACGHSEIVETACELSQDQPFYMKVACPDYHLARDISRGECGFGGYWCRETKDGQYFARVKSVHDEAETRIQDIDARVAFIKTAVSRFLTAASHGGQSLEDRKRHPDCLAILARRTHLLQERCNLSEMRALSLMVFQEGIYQHSKRVEHILNGYPDATFSLPVTLANRLPSQLQLDPHLNTTGFHNISITTHAIDVSAEIHPQPMKEYRSFKPMDIGENIVVTPRRSYAQASREMMQQEPSNPQIAARRKGRRPRRQRDPDESDQRTSTAQISASPRKVNLPKEDSTVRRSARVHGKKVSYAESEVSSREASPDNSDSPYKSDQTGSPTKSEQSWQQCGTGVHKETSKLSGNDIRHTGDTLGSRIGEWKKKTSSVTMPSRRPSLGLAYVEPIQPKQVPTAGCINPNMGSQSLPPQSYQIPNHAFGLPHPAGAANFLSGTAEPNTPANLFSMYANQSSGLMQLPTNIYDPVELALDEKPRTDQSASATPMERSDSGVAAPPLAFNNSKTLPTSNGYEQLRRSFSAAAELTPPTSADMISADTDPKKRRHPVSSPLLSNKRTCLSLPEPEPTFGVYNGHLPDEKTAPAAVMYIPTDNGGDGGPGNVDPSSDIDWSLMNDDLIWIDNE